MSFGPLFWYTMSDMLKEKQKMEHWEQHPDEDVRAAIVKLCDALCTWERNTGRNSVLILREDHGFEFRAQSGKPGIPHGISDATLLSQFVKPCG